MAPLGIYVGKTGAELLALRLIAEDRIANGDRTSLSGGGKSSGRTFSMSGAEMLREINYALNRLRGTSPVTRTYFNASGVRAVYP